MEDVTGDHQDEARRQEKQDREHLDHGRPRLDEPVELHAEQVAAHDRHRRDQGRDPSRDLWPPELHVHRERGDLAHPGHGGERYIDPPRHEREAVAHELARVGDPRARGGAVDHELPQGAHEQVHHGGDHQVGDDQRGARRREAPADAQEQTHADGTTDADHLDLEVAQGLLVPLVPPLVENGHGAGGRGLWIEGHGVLLLCEVGHIRARGQWPVHTPGRGWPMPLPRG